MIEATGTRREDLSLADELGRWLLERRPGLLVADAAVTGEVCGALAEALGCNLALVLTKAGPDAYVDLLKRMMRKADAAAQAVTNNAHALAEAGQGFGHA